MINSIQFPEYGQYLADLGCPLCGSKLDGNCHPNGAQLHCARDSQEYVSGWVFGIDEPTYEHIKHTFNECEYVIRQRRVGNGKYEIFVTYYSVFNFAVINLDGYSPSSTSYKKEMLSLTTNRLEFFSQKLTEEEFINKLKLYLVFS